ncbi:MAG: archaellin/type IV pilin N-terminal domain-containing protein [Candidatus Lutacidiplasmatales archaeon]
MSSQNLGHPRWRKKGRRGVSPIIATILLVAITVVLAAVLYILISGLTKGPGNTPIGTALAVGKAVPNGANGYTMVVQSAGSGMIYSNLNFQVQAAGAIVTGANGPTTMTVLGITGCNVAVYTFATNAWAVPGANLCAATGGTAGVTSGQEWSMANGASLSGDTLIIIGAGSYSGSETSSLP